MASQRPCECECERFELNPVPGVYGGDYPPFSVDGDVFAASATVDASSSMALRITGLLDAPIACVASWTQSFDMMQALNASSSVSVNGASKKLIRVGKRIPLRFDACAVAANLLLTGSAECSAKMNASFFDATHGGIWPIALNFYKDGEHWPNQNQLSSWLSDIYSKTPPDGVWGNVASQFEIYRDGVLIESFSSTLVNQEGKTVVNVHPFPPGVKAKCEQEGSYLVVAKHLSAAPSGPNTVASYPTGIGPGGLTPLVSYGSFVVLNTKFAFARTLQNDYFATQAIGVPATDFRENPFKEQFGAAGSAPENDIAGNEPLFAGPLPQATFHAPPANGKSGARSAFLRPMPFGAEDSLVLDYPLEKITIRFDRPVVGVTAAMFSVAGYVPPNGSAATIQVLSVSPLDSQGYGYEVVISTQGQVPNSMWIITFTPNQSVGVAIPKFQVREFPSRQSFPAAGVIAALYVDKSTGDRYAYEYVTGDSGQYVIIENPEETEYGTTVLAARFMWCRAKDKSIGRFWINTLADGNPLQPAQDRVLIPRASASTTVTPPDSPLGDMSLTLLTNVREVIDPSSSKRSTLSDQGRTDFLPRLPGSSTTPTDGRFSYFGIPTTIHPAAPRWIGECQSPSETQRHASLIFTGDDIGSFNVTIPQGFDVPSGFRFFFPWQLPNPKALVDASDSLNPSFLAGPATAMPQALSVALTSSEMSQNFWAKQNHSASLTRLSQGDRVETTIESVTVVMAANRGRLTYREMHTTTVTELVLSLFVLCSGTFRWRKFTDNNGTLGPWLGTRSFTSDIGVADIIVPPDREGSFGSFGDLTITKG
jgi:hypothetical protein